MKLEPALRRAGRAKPSVWRRHGRGCSVTPNGAAALAASGPLGGVNPYRFSSKEWQPAAGLYYYGCRSYDPNVQRWVNRNPLVEAGFANVSKALVSPLGGGVNQYLFVFNDPWLYVDSFGHDLESCISQAAEQYLKNIDGILANVALGHYVLTPVLAAGTLGGGYGVVQSGEAGLLADGMEALLVLGGAALASHEVRELDELESKAKIDLAKVLNQCAQNNPHPSLQDAQQKTRDAFNHIAGGH